MLQVRGGSWETIQVNINIWVKKKLGSGVGPKIRPGSENVPCISYGSGDGRHNGLRVGVGKFYK